MFCSELVAALYQRLGLLDAPFPASHDYVPADFAQSLGNPIELVGFDDGGGQGTDGRSGEKEVGRFEGESVVLAVDACVGDV